MPQTIQEERFRWITPLLEKEMTMKQLLRICPHSESSLKRWKRAYKKNGMNGLIPQSTEPKTQKNETSIEIKEKVIQLRKETGLCALKLHWKLTKQGVHIHERTIGKILKKEGLVKKYRVRKIQYKHIKVERRSGELIEIDVKHVPGPIKGMKYYQYTAIDTASRWRHLEIFDQETSHHSIKFLQIVMKKFPHTIKAIKTDNHSTFTNYYLGTNKRSDLTVKTIHALDVFCGKHNIVHYLIDPGKPTQNGTVERSHGEDQRKFYEQNEFKTVQSLRRRIRVWNDYYNDLEHCGLSGKTPNEMICLQK